MFICRVDFGVKWKGYEKNGFLLSGLEKVGVYFFVVYFFIVLFYWAFFAVGCIFIDVCLNNFCK